jgi:hypothetical protein
VEGGALVALMAAGLAKAVGNHIASSSDLGFLGEMLKVTSDVAGKTAEGPIKGWVESWLRPKRRERMLNRATWQDLAGLAWGEHLYETDPDVLMLAFGEAERVQHRLDAEWFVELLSGPRGREIQPPKAEPAYGETLEPAFVSALAELLAEESAERLGIEIEDPVRLREYLTTAVGGLPKRISRLTLQVPGADTRLSRLMLAEQVVPKLDKLLSYMDGTEASREALEHMVRMAQEALKLADRDTFGRDHFEDLPKLVHREVYVEPDAGEDNQRAGPAKTQIRAAWERVPFVILRAPFGMGKSLTYRELAIELAQEWLEDPGRPFPLRLDCPDLLLGNVASLREAVYRHLEARGFSEEAIRWLWSKAPLTILLDSFDEVTQPEGQLKRWLEDMLSATRRQGLRVLLCSRPYGYDPEWIKGEHVALDLHPLDDEQAREWLERHGQALGRPTPSLEQIEARLDEQLARTPILLLMAVFAWDQQTAEGIEGKAGLYARFVDRTSTGKWAEIQEPHPVIGAAQRSLGAELYQEALARVAWAHLVHTGDQDASRGLPVRELEAKLKAWRPLSDAQLVELTRALVLSLFFRQSDLQGELRFSHRSFREFLCARYLLLQAEREREYPGDHPLLLALAEANPGRETLRFLEEMLRPQPELLQSTLAVVEAAFDRDEEVVFVGNGLRLHNWQGRHVGLLSERWHHSFLRCCDMASAALRRQSARPEASSLGGGWVIGWEEGVAWHRESGRLAFYWPSAQGDPREFNLHGFDGQELCRGVLLYWLEGMREPRATHRQLATLWGELGAHLAAREPKTLAPTWLTLLTSEDGRWLLGGPGYVPHGTWMSAWARSARRVLEVAPATPTLRPLQMSLVLATENLGPSWSELLGLWSAFVEQCDG